jgi:hypothetical protein
MPLLATALTTLLFGSFGYFVFLMCCYAIFPKSTLGCLSTLFILAAWIALTVVFIIISTITGLGIPPIALALLAAYPSFKWATKGWSTQDNTP